MARELAHRRELYASDASVTSSCDGHFVAATRRRRSARASSGAWNWNGRIDLSSLAGSISPADGDAARALPASAPRTNNPAAAAVNVVCPKRVMSDFFLERSRGRPKWIGCAPDADKVASPARLFHWTKVSPIPWYWRRRRRSALRRTDTNV